MDLSEVLPTPEALFASSELKKMRTDANFKFLVKSGYEHIERVCTHLEEQQEEEEAMQE